MYALRKFDAFEVIVLLRGGYKQLRNGEYGEYGEHFPCSACLNFQLIPKCYAISR